MKAKDIVLIILGGLAFLFLYLFLEEHQRRKRAEQLAARALGERDFFKTAYLNQLETMLIQNDAPSDTLKELEKLKNFYEDINVEVHKQIQTVINLLKDEYKEKAILDMAKIVEVILKDSYEKEENKKCNKTFHKLLEYAESKNWIDAQDRSFAIYVKRIRNEEGHELNVSIEHREACLAIFSGIHLAYKLTKK